MKYRTAPLSIGIGFGLAIGLFVASIIAFPAGPAQSREPDRTLRLFFGHTGERGEFTFKRNGRYDRSELARINQFLRDWRKGEPARMDPQLLDLVWSIYKASGSRDYIHIVSAYRSAQTNKALRSRSSGVAKNSQHILGKAMDFYLPDVPLAKLRGIAMKMQGGGVGYYPKSGSPFVHVDTGNVRAWPRMSRQQLIALFPHGNTLHLPSDGKPLPGYELAVAKRKAGGSTALAYLDTETSEAEVTDRTGTSGTASGWLKRVFPGDGPEEDDVAAVEPAAPAPPVEPLAIGEPQLLTASVDATATEPRTPRARPLSETETAISSDADSLLATIDADALTSLSVAPTAPPVPVARPGNGSEDALAVLAARAASELAAQNDPARQIELAFAALNDVPPPPPPPSAADRAILMAFAALDEPGAVRNADPDLAAAVTRRAADAGAQHQPPVTLERAPGPIVVAALAPVAVAAPVAQAADTGPGIVIGPAEAASYGDDQPALVDLIEAPAVTNAGAEQLAMPKPQSDLLVAPEAASEITDLRGQAGPPVDHFARNDASDSEQGFFSRLFAGLIE